MEKETEAEKEKEGRGRPKAEIDEQELLQLREKGFSCRKIAEKLNISCSTVSKRLKELEK